VYFETVFWDAQGILPLDILDHDATLNADHYRTTLWHHPDGTLWLAHRESDPSPHQLPLPYSHYHKIIPGAVSLRMFFPSTRQHRPYI
jgi:hypothetical protein